MEKVKIGFIGAGYMGQLAHLTNYVQLPEECEIVAIAETRRQLAEEVARRNGISRVFTDHQEMLKCCELDGVVAAQGYANHINIVPDVLNARIPLLTEKPLCVSVENGEMIVECAERNKTLHMVGYHKRSDPALEYAKKLIDEWKATGEYGKLRMVRLSMPPGDWTGGSPRPVTTSEEYPQVPWEGMPACFDKETGEAYNAFVNYYIHQVNAMRFLMGEPYKLTYADKSGVLLVAESESGVCGTLEMAAYNNTIEWQESMFIAFERAHILVELPPPLACRQAGRVTVMKDNGQEAPVTLHPHMPWVSAMQNQARNFLAAIRGERPAPCESREALEDLRIAMDYIRMHCR